MPNLPWGTIAVLYILLITPLGVIIGRLLRSRTSPKPWPRPAVIAAAQRGLHQRDQSNDRQ